MIIMSVAEPLTHPENLDRLRSEALASSHVVEPHPDLPPRHFQPAIEVDASTRMTRAGLAVSRLVRAAGAISLVVGVYSTHANVEDVYKAKDAIVEDVSSMDNRSFDRATSKLLTGTSVNPERDVATAQNGSKALIDTINRGVDDMVDAGSKAATGIQDIAMGGLLVGAGQVGTSLLKRHRKKQLSFLESSEFASNKLFNPSRRYISITDSSDTSRVVTLRQTRHYGDRFHRASYLYEKYFAVAAGAVLLSGVGLSASFAETADSTLTNAVHETILEDAQQPFFEDAAKRFRASIERDIRQGVEAELPLTMQAIETDEKAQNIYGEFSGAFEDTSSERIEELADIETKASFFTRMRDRLQNHYRNSLTSGVLLFGALGAGVVLAISKKAPNFTGTGKTKVSQQFLETHLNKQP